MKAGVLAIIALGAIVWGFALIGIISIAQAIGPSAARTPAPLLVPRTEVAETGPVIQRAPIADLPEYPGAAPSEYRQEVFGTERVTEIEYVVDSSAQEVRRHYRETFAQRGWTVTESTWVRGEWTYAVRLEAQHGIVEIERRNGLTEVEIEIAEPSPVRGGLTDR